MEEWDMKEGQKRPEGGWLKTVLLGLGLAIISLFRKGPAVTGIEAELEEERKIRRMILRGWIVVCAMSLLFVAYGFLAFFIVGDKGPPDWDDGSVPDVPAQSVYSTYPYSEHAGPPEPQHVDQRPAGVGTGVSGEGKTPLPEKGPE